MQTMFVITGLACNDHQSDPDFALAHNAAVQAVRTAVHLAPELDARTIYLGSPLKGYIQGQPPAPPTPSSTSSSRPTAPFAPRSST